MNTERVAASALIQASAERIYAILADYRDGHARILPKGYFSSLEVEQGGIGAGTVIRFQMRALGTTRNFRASVTETEPGHELVETNFELGRADAGQKPGGLTIFSVDPLVAGRSANVTIATELPIHSGIAGWLERFLTAAFLRRVYAQELALLAALAEGRSQGLPA